MESPIVVSGRLSGHDFRGLRVYRRWNTVGGIMLAIGLVVSGWTSYLYRSLPPWIQNRPLHYQFGDQDRNKIMAVFYWICNGWVLYYRHTLF
jgi:hypothetical protein